MSAGCSHSTAQPARCRVVISFWAAGLSARSPSDTTASRRRVQRWRRSRSCRSASAGSVPAPTAPRHQAGTSPGSHRRCWPAWPTSSTCSTRPRPSWPRSSGPPACSGPTTSTPSRRTRSARAIPRRRQRRARGGLVRVERALSRRVATVSQQRIPPRLQQRAAGPAQQRRGHDRRGGDHHRFLQPLRLERTTTVSQRELHHRARRLHAVRSLRLRQQTQRLRPAQPLGSLPRTACAARRSGWYWVRAPRPARRAAGPRPAPASRPGSAPPAGARSARSRPGSTPGSGAGTPD